MKITGNKKFNYIPITKPFNTLHNDANMYDLVWWFRNYFGLKFIVQILTYALFISQKVINQLTSQTQVHAQ